ncbi:hypothetical protein B0H12DRAFT_650688 [Mycena haematopus]|nr:hypothetical protein B0H12DRAFT_650688 [Mycena haematopus]
MPRSTPHIDTKTLRVTRRHAQRPRRCPATVDPTFLWTVNSCSARPPTTVGCTLLFITVATRALLAYMSVSLFRLFLYPIDTHARNTPLLVVRGAWRMLAQVLSTQSCARMNLRRGSGVGVADECGGGGNRMYLPARNSRRVYSPRRADDARRRHQLQQRRALGAQETAPAGARVPHRSHAAPCARKGSCAHCKR